VAVAARADKGRANAEVLEVLARALGLGEGSLRIASGSTDRRKGIEVDGLGPSEALGRLAPRLDGV
jgi:uncharacterized protein YggU (UPF0235/DUF167 family)